MPSFLMIQVLVLVGGDGNVELVELLLRDFTGRAHHDVLRVLVHGEGDDLADGAFAGQQHDHAVHARGDARVGGAP